MVYVIFYIYLWYCVVCAPQFVKTLNIKEDSNLKIIYIYNKIKHATQRTQTTVRFKFRLNIKPWWWRRTQDPTEPIFMEIGLWPEEKGSGRARRMFGEVNLRFIAPQVGCPFSPLSCGKATKGVSVLSYCCSETRRHNNLMHVSFCDLLSRMTISRNGFN